eukprot:1614278-Alexandrium_andersonii.AAC.1
MPGVGAKRCWIPWRTIAVCLSYRVRVCVRAWRVIRVASVLFLATHYVALPCARLRPGSTAAARSVRCSHDGRRLMLSLGQEARRRPVARVGLWRRRTHHGAPSRARPRPRGAAAARCGCG